MQSNKIILAGFSGAGKSCFLEALKETAFHKVEFSDLDEIVLPRLGTSSIHEFVKREGWDKFRLLEAQALRDWVSSTKSGVLALGGGSLRGSMLDWLMSQPDVDLIHLRADFDTCWERIRGQGSEKPLVQKGEEFMRKLFEERSEIFQKIPQVIENDGKKTLRELAQDFWSRFEG